MESIELVNVDIVVDSDQTCYQCGDIVSGRVDITLNGQMKLSFVSIMLKSNGEVVWVEYPLTGLHRAGFIFRDNQTFLDQTYQIPDNLRDTVIENGDHSIPFAFKLPEKDIPSSFDALNGYIKYWIEVVIMDDKLPLDHKQGIVAFKDKKEITVESPFLHNLHFSVGGGTEKNVGILCVGGGKLRIDANIKKKGHFPGEVVDVHCVVANTSTVDVTPRISFRQLQIYMVRDRHITVEETTDYVVGEKVDAGDTREQILSIEVPKEVPLSIKTRLIVVKYFIHVTLDIPRERDLHINLPLIVTNQFALDRYSSFV